MKVAEWFVKGRRLDGDEFWKLAAGSPAWLDGAIYDAHDDELPNDWTYEACRSMCVWLDNDWSEDTDASEFAASFAEAEVEYQTSSLFRWYADVPARAHWADAAFEEAGKSGFDDVASILRRGQYDRLVMIASVFIAAYEEARRG